MTYPTYIFDSNTNYADVLETTKQMFTYLDAVGDGCCKSPSMLKIMHQASVKLLAVSYNASDDLNDLARWKKGIEVSYKLLFPLT